MQLRHSKGSAITQRKIHINMAKIYSSDLSKELREGARLQTAKDIIPSELAEKVVPVMEVNPKMLRRITVFKETTKNTTASTTIYSTPSDRDFYLSAAYFSLQADAACDNVSGQIIATQEGSGKAILRIMKITLTATSGQMTLSLPEPMKIDRGTNITLNTSFTVGACSMTGGIFGYIDEMSKA